MSGLSLLSLLTAGASSSALAWVFPPGVTSRDVPRLMAATAWVRSLDEAALVKLAPEQSGLYFVGCPNCTGGRQEGQLAWTSERPDEVYCRYCNHRYPGEKYPMREALEVRNPRGELQRYPYWADAKGYRYFFQARRDDLVRAYLTDRARELAQLYAVTGERAHAWRAALILDRFAQVFPGWCYHYDYPFQQKVIYEGDVPPEKFRAGYRTARWTWWAYSDVPVALVEAYDWIRDSGVLAELSRLRGADVAARIERDLFRNAAGQVLANPETFSNMSPSCWRSLVTAGRVIGEPSYVHEPLRRLRQFVETRFFYDGVWPEGAPSYHAQTVGGLSNVLRVLKGHSDPPGYVDPADGERFDDLDLEASFPALVQANASLMKMRLPNGRFVPVHDTWSTDKRAALASTEPYLWPALGHACLGGGAGDNQSQFHLTWSGGYGHQHGDNLSLLVFALGREMLSDVGYSHTRYRSWTLATAAHNTVVIDGESQAFGSEKAPSDGSLRWLEARDPRVQVVSAEGRRGYPSQARQYRRTLVVIDAGQDRRYAVDLFEVEGGAVHDYFLHGDADVPSVVSAAVALAPLATLLPPGFDWRPTENEGQASRARERHYAYGFLRNLRSAPVEPGAPLPVVFAYGGGSPGLRVTLLPEAASRLVLGENPSIRGAGEDDSKLDAHTRPFLLLRREVQGGRSLFAAVIEPYGEAPFITSVERIDLPGAELAVRVALAGREDLIALGPGERLAVRAGDFTLALGVAERLRLEAVEGDALVLAGTVEAPPAAGQVVRLVTADGWVYPYTVVSTEPAEGTLRVRVAEGPGLALDAARERLRLSAFPQREHSGAVWVEWDAAGTSGGRQP